jgi:2-polyprenyl-6-methoxyphenol hydroxylase-like FAD-dependent oxidoreductase
MHETTVQARIVIAADGLGGGFLHGSSEFKMKVSKNSHVGVGTLAKSAPSFYEEGITFMAVTAGNYLGLVRLEDGQLNIAGAFDPRFIQLSKSPGLAAQSIIRQTGLPAIEGLEALNWIGKPSLTRRRMPLAANRVFVIGDAASYIEPFTGEGMSWALASGVAVAPFALEAIQEWKPSIAARWENHYRRFIGRRQTLSKCVTALLKYPTLTRSALNLLSFIPSLSKPLVKYANAPIK